MTPVDRAALDARLLTPERPRLAEALACVLAMEPDIAHEVATTPGVVWDEAHWSLAWTRDGTTRVWRTERDLAGPGDAWETLASRGVIPLDWPGDERRRFVSYEWWRAPSGPNLDPLVAPHPVTLRSCVTLASDPDGVATAEALAREVATRLAPWGVPCPERILWRLDARPYDPRGARGDGFSARLSDALRDALTGEFRSVPAWTEGADEAGPGAPLRGDMRDWRPPWRARARELVRLRESWGLAAARRAAAPVTGEARTFDALPDPFAPLLDLWLRGYALDEVRDDAIVLLAREAGDGARSGKPRK